MQRFELDQTISSCTVTKNLVRQLESYVTEKVAAVSGVARHQLQESLRIRIVEPRGTTVIKTIADYTHELLPDRTEKVSIECDVYSPATLRVQIVFHKTSYRSRIMLDIENDNAREIALSVDSGLRRVIADFTNYHKVLHPPTPVAGLLWAVWYTAGLLNFIPMLSKESSLARVIPSVTMPVWILLALCWVSSRLFPYTAFDSKRYRSAKAVRNFILLGLAGFLLFGTIFVLLRRRLLGF